MLSMQGTRSSGSSLCVPPGSGSSLSEGLDAPVSSCCPSALFLLGRHDHSLGFSWGLHPLGSGTMVPEGRPSGAGLVPSAGLHSGYSAALMKTQGCAPGGPWKTPWGLR